MIVDPNCKNDHWRVDKLDELVLGEISKLALDQKKISNKKGGAVKTSVDRVKALTKEIEKIDKKRERLLDLYMSGTFDATELDEKARPLTEQRDALVLELERASDDKDDAEQARDMIRSCADIIKRGVYTEIRTMIEALIDRIEIDGQDVTIFWRFS